MEPRKTRPMTGKPIGQLNGPWALLLKIVLVLIPIAAAIGVPWVQWQTKSAYSSEETRIIVDKLGDGVQALNKQYADGLSPEWKERIKLLENDARRNLQDHTDMKVSLEQIKSKLGVPSTPPASHSGNSN